MPWDLKWVRDYSNWIYLGLLLPSSIAVGVALGYFADRWFNTDPWGKILGFFLGVFAGGLNFYRDYQKLIKKEKDESSKH